MDRLPILVALLLLSGSSIAAHVNVGDCARLEERSLNIPAHPQPGDGSVPFRFESGSSVTVRQIDAATGWVKVESSLQQRGWITHRYLEETVDPALCGTEIDLPDWCPPPRSADPHPSGRLRIATWNIANLHRANGQSVFPPPRQSEIRQDEDYARILCYVRMFDPDILAVQEVDGEEALARVIDRDVYEIHVSSRGAATGRQNTGFAFKRGLNVVPQPDFTDLDVTQNGRLRHGTVIRATHNGAAFKMMSVHLESQCFDDTHSGEDCDTLFEQVPVLERWIDREALSDEPFIVLGDFNRRFNIQGDTIWAELDDGVPPNSDLSNVTANKSLGCRRDQPFDHFIDHIVFDARSWLFADDASFRHLSYRIADEDTWDQISDHCPLVVDIWPQ